MDSGGFTMQFEDRTERCLRLAKEEHFCPHCKQKLSCCEAPPFHIGDGLGWGTDVLFICLNDECPLFAGSWQQFEEQYGHSASCRYVLCPGNTTGESMMVGGKDAFKNSVINIEDLQRQNTRFAEEKAASAQLDTCVAEKNLEPVLYLLLDEHADLAVRKRACGLLLELQDAACVDPLRNHTFRNTDLEQMVNLTIAEMLKQLHLRECPYCAELIKAQAKICKHCGKEV